VVQDCLWYSGTISRTRGVTDCGQCNSKVWMNIYNENNGPKTIHCSDTSNDDQQNPTCTGTSMTGCDQLTCVETVSGTTYAMGCRLCSAGYKGGNTPVPDVGYTDCVDDADTIPNCSVWMPTDNTSCYSCTSGNAVRSDSKACLTYSDTNCRMLGLAGQSCRECKNNYYLVNNVCTLGYDASTATTTTTTTATATTTTGANLMTASAFIMALLVFFN